MTFTSLVGARSASILPKNGSRPLQFENRMNRKNAANSGMCRRASGPPSETAQFSRLSQMNSTAFWSRPGTSLIIRPATMNTSSRRPITIHIVKHACSGC